MDKIVFLQELKDFHFDYIPREFQIQWFFSPTRFPVNKLLYFIFSKQDFDLALGVQHECEKTDEKHTRREINYSKVPVDPHQVSFPTGFDFTIMYLKTHFWTCCLK